MIVDDCRLPADVATSVSVEFQQLPHASRPADSQQFGDRSFSAIHLVISAAHTQNQRQSYFRGGRGRELD